jgi:hypothetical protein
VRKGAVLEALASPAARDEAVLSIVLLGVGDVDVERAGGRRRRW